MTEYPKRDVILRDQDWNDSNVVNAEIVGDHFAVHPGRTRDEKMLKGWIVTHATTGWEVLGNAGPFSTRAGAIAYAEALAQAPVIWLFRTKDEMLLLNNEKELRAVVQAARITANIIDGEK